MAVWSGIITAKGLELQAKLIAGSTLTITRIVAGAGKVPAGDLETQSAVTDPRQQLSANPITINRDKKAEIPVLLENVGVVTEYTVHQVGFYASDPDDGEILYLLAQDDAGEVIPTETDSPKFSVSWTFAIGFGNATQISIHIDPQTYITYEMAKELFAPRGHGLGEDNLQTGKDLNDLTKTGWYGIGNGCTGLPAAVKTYEKPSDSKPALLKVESSGPVVNQYFYPYTQRFAWLNDSFSSTGYYRQKVDASWQGWTIVAGITGIALSENTDLFSLYQPGSFNIHITTAAGLSQLPEGARAGRYGIVNTDIGDNRIQQQVLMADESGNTEGALYYRLLEDNQAANPVWGGWTRLVTSSELEDLKNNFASKILPEIKEGASETARKISLDGITSYDQLYGVELTVISGFTDYLGDHEVTFEVNNLGAKPVYFLGANGVRTKQCAQYWAPLNHPYKITYIALSGTESVFYAYAYPYVMATEERYGTVKLAAAITDTTSGNLVPNVNAIRASILNAGGTVRQATAPDNTRMTWIDSSDEDKPKYYNGTAWVPFVAVWG